MGYFRCPQCGLLYIDLRQAPAREANQELYGDRRAHYVLDDEQQRRHERRARRVLRHLAARGVKGRLLEVGCAEGLFLSVAQAEGWEAHGIEIEPQAADYGRERWALDIFCGAARDAPWPPASFDAAYMSNVLEHLGEPLGVLEAVRRLLRPGGLLYIKTGNVDSYTFRTLGAKWYYLDFATKAHVAFYGPRSAAFALERAGFPRQGVRIRTTGVHAARRGGPLWRRVAFWLLNPWAHLTRQGDTLLVEARRG